MASHAAPRERGPTVAQRRLFLSDPQFPLQESKFPRPIRKRQAESFHIRMAGTERRFHLRDLPAAAGDSLLPLAAFRSHVLERPTVAIQRGRFPAQRLPALHDHINVLGIEFHAEADSFGEFRGR